MRSMYYFAALPPPPPLPRPDPLPPQEPPKPKKIKDPTPRYPPYDPYVYPPDYPWKLTPLASTWVWAKWVPPPPEPLPVFVVEEPKAPLPLPGEPKPAHTFKETKGDACYWRITHQDRNWKSAETTIKFT